MGFTGKWLLSAREWAGVGWSEFATRLGMSVRDLAKIEDEDLSISIELERRAHTMADGMVRERGVG